MSLLLCGHKQGLGLKTCSFKAQGVLDHLDVVRGPSTPHDPESDAGGSLSSWQGHPSR
jgi:hypothetical protein